jgi:hypothetical protein
MDAREMQPLAAVRADLLRGDFGDLASHLAALSELEARLTGKIDASSLIAVRSEAERTRDVLASAAAGVRAALRRLGEAGAPAAIYAPDGRRVPLEGVTPCNESRA